MSAVTRAPASIGIAGTTLAHGLLVGAMLLVAHRSRELPTVSYAVNLLAAPAPSTATARGGEVAPPQPTPEKTVATKPSAKPKKPIPQKPPARKPVPETSKAAAKAVPPKSVTTPLAGETPSTGQDVLTRTFPGLDFPDKEYLAGIVNQIYSRFAQQDWPPGLEATVGFTIHRDGSVTDIVMLKSSRWSPFNLAAKSAVVATAAANVLGPLPKIWPSDELQIAFSFSPRKP
jgi:outer membrane biosynthesis protein TonB